MLWGHLIPCRSPYERTLQKNLIINPLAFQSYLQFSVLLKAVKQRQTLFANFSFHDWWLENQSWWPPARMCWHVLNSYSLIPTSSKSPFLPIMLISINYFQHVSWECTMYISPIHYMCCLESIGYMGWNGGLESFSLFFFLLICFVVFASVPWSYRTITAATFGGKVRKCHYY